MFIGPSTSQVREFNVVLEEGGEREWVFTLLHTDQVSEDVSLSLTRLVKLISSRHVQSSRRTAVEQQRCTIVFPVDVAYFAPSVCTVLTIMRWLLFFFLFQNLGPLNPRGCYSCVHVCISQDMHNLMTSLHKVLETSVVKSAHDVTSSPLKIRLILTPAKPDGTTKPGEYFKVTTILLGIHLFCAGDIAVLVKPQQQRPSRVSSGSQSGDFTARTRTWSAETTT